MKKLISYIMTVTFICCSLFSAYASTYKDVGSEFDWAADAIGALTEKNILSGYGNGDFKPDANVTKAEIAKILVSAFGKKSKVTYADVHEGDWFYNDVTNSGELFLPKDNFEPNNYATRQEVAYALYKAADAKASPLSIFFTDTAEINNSYYDAVAFLTNAGIITGYPDNTFQPKNSITRAETAVIIYKALYFDFSTEEEPAPSAVPSESAAPSESPTPAPTANNQANNYFFVVTKVSTAMENGDTVMKVTGYHQGEVEEITISADLNIKYLSGTTDKISQNDIISFTRDYFGTVKSVQVLYRLNEKDPETLKLSYQYTSKKITVVGTVLKNYKNKNLEILNHKGEKVVYYVNSDANVYAFKNGKIETSVIDNVYDSTYQETGDFVICMSDDEELKEIVIIK